jgi:hypothetical protein
LICATATWPKHRSVLLALLFSLLLQPGEPAQVAAVAPDIYVAGWSPDSEWVAYFTHERSEQLVTTGDLHLYNPTIKETCIFQDAPMDLIFQNGDLSLHNLWLKDGRFLSLGARAFLSTPCAQVNYIDDVLPEADLVIDAYSPQMNTVLLRSQEALWLLSVDELSVRPVVNFVSDEADGFIAGRASASLDGKQFAYTQYGAASTHVIDIETAQARKVLADPDPAGRSILTGTYVTPIWLTDELLFVDSTTLGTVIVDVTREEIFSIQDKSLKVLEAARPTWSEFWWAVVEDESGERSVYSSAYPDNLLPLPPAENVFLGPDGRTILLHQGRLVSSVRPQLASSEVANDQPIAVVPTYPEIAWAPVEERSFGSYVIADSQVLFMIGDELYRIYAPEIYRFFDASPAGWSPDGRNLVVTAQSFENEHVLLLFTLD